MCHICSTAVQVLPPSGGLIIFTPNFVDLEMEGCEKKEKQLVCCKQGKAALGLLMLRIYLLRSRRARMRALSPGWGIPQVMRIPESSTYRMTFMRTRLLAALWCLQVHPCMRLPTCTILIILFFWFFIALDTGPRRPLSLELSDKQKCLKLQYEPASD